MPLPEYGKWRLNHPLFGQNPPFPILEVFLGARNSGAALFNNQRFELLQVVAHPGDSKFLARYRVNSDHGIFEAKVQPDQSLKVEFSGGTVETTCDGQLIQARGRIDGVPFPETRIEEVAASHPIHCAGDIARWFDGLVLENEHQLKRLCDTYAKRNPDSWIAVGLANTGKDLYSVVAHQGQGLVDTLRLGEGCSEGGWGIGKDLLRALSFLPAFKAVKPLASRINTVRYGRYAASAEVAGGEAGAARAAGAAARTTAPIPRPMPGSAASLPGPLARDPGGPICWAVAAVNAMQQFNGKLWMPVSKLLELFAGGKRARMLEELSSVLPRFGVTLSRLRVWVGAEEIVKITGETPAGSVVMFGVTWTKGSEMINHALVAYRDWQGTVWIIDRTAEASGRLVRSLAELETVVPGYSGIAGGIITEAYRLQNCTGGFIRDAGKLLFALGFTTAITVQAIEARNADAPR